MVETTQQEKLENILEKVEKDQRSEQTRRVYKSTLKGSTILAEEIKQYNEDLDPPREEIKALIKENDAPRCKCPSWSRLWGKCFFWNPFRRARLWHRGSNDSLYAVDKQALSEDVNETLHKVREILELLSRENLEKRLLNCGPVKRPCGVPEKPAFTVGLDEPLRKLKAEILRDGVSVLVLTGLGGSGKTTLATQLCWDEQVKGKVLTTPWFSDAS